MLNNYFNFFFHFMRAEQRRKGTLYCDTFKVSGNISHLMGKEKWFAQNNKKTREPWWNLRQHRWGLDVAYWQAFRSYRGSAAAADIFAGNISANCIKITSTQCIQTATWWCCVSVTPKHRLSSNHLKPETCLVFPVFCVSPSSFHCRIWFSLSHLPPHFWLLGYFFPPLLQTSIEPPLSALPCIISQASLSHQCHFYSAGFR